MNKKIKSGKHSCMKVKVYKSFVFVALIFVFSLIFSLIFCGCSGNTIYTEADDLLRLHIRAASNDDADQAVKLKVRDGVASRVESIAANALTFDAACQKVSDNIALIESACDAILAAEGFSYKAHAVIRDEYFPTRQYGNIILESGTYKSLIVELGAGAGDNWWCVIYPPLCYDEGGTYKSFIKELIDKFG